jgi:hypothetical protein
LEALDRKKCVSVRLGDWVQYVTGANYHEAGYDSYITGGAFDKMAHIIRTDHGTSDVWAALHDCLGKVPLSGSHFSSLDLHSPETNDAAFYENMLHLCSLKTVEVCSQLRSYSDVRIVKTGPQSYLARFPRLDDRVSCLAEVIDDITLS